MKKLLLSFAVFFAVLTLYAGPSRPGLIRVLEYNHNSASIEWKRSYLADDEEERWKPITYEINFRTRKSEKPSDWFFVFGGRETSAVITGLTPNTKYEIRIVAWAGGHASPARINEKGFTTRKRPILYQHVKLIPTGFSMISVPFTYGDNKIGTLFGPRYSRNLVVYKYNPESGFTVNGYDDDFDSWDDPDQILSAGTAIWILNNGKDSQLVPFKGYLPNDWRALND
mgnify:FL=1